MKAKFKTIVKRSNWLRGGKFGEGTLLNAEGKMCCLGFRCEQAGVARENLQDNEMPWCITGKSKLRKWLIDSGANEAVDKAAQINDDAKMEDSQREIELKELFASQDEEIEFVD